jgi:transcription elongation factor Elf1
MSLNDSYEFYCPYCNAANTLPIDVSGGNKQNLLTDCDVCCAPIAIRLRLQNGEIIHIDVRKENE